MTEIQTNLYNQIFTYIADTHRDDLPTLEEITKSAEDIRKMFSPVYKVTDEEFAEIQTLLYSEISHTIGDSVTIRGDDVTHRSWYFTSPSDNFYWDRYKKYLSQVKHWNQTEINQLNKTTDTVMDELGDPNTNEPFQRRGLLLGDVQAGKTATYTAICNKAVDVHYRVIIILSGMTENLRIQTQKRLDSDFVGTASKFFLDKKATTLKKEEPVGVGKIRNNKKNPKNPIACFTSSQTDFKVETLKALRLSLDNIKGAALFVVKKNKSILNNLIAWLSASFNEKQIEDYPMLFIDDEADNASINTHSAEQDPTAINTAIRTILSMFKQASYIAVTATPFANIFIDPDTVHNDLTDLFPKHFITMLPSPSHYIGPDKIFGNGSLDEWEAESRPGPIKFTPEGKPIKPGKQLSYSSERTGGEYGSSIISISNLEQSDYYSFRHKMDLAYKLVDIPGSLKDAIRCFILITAISDYRKDVKAHRSMLVNVSRFTKVQDRTVDLIDTYLTYLKNEVENYAQTTPRRFMTYDAFIDFKKTWDGHELDKAAGISWENLVKKYLYDAIRRVKVKAVNRTTGPNSLNYDDHPEGWRIIAVGGNNLSRGMTLEGLCVSYFYRSSTMYDTLLQMGRWFGYRSNYDDLFKIWMGEDAIDWYGYITDAVNELKDEIWTMNKLGKTPEEFGLRVRQAPVSLMVTARTKMRSGVAVSIPITVSGRMLETPRLKYDSASLGDNESHCLGFIKGLKVKCEYDPYTHAYIWRDIPKAKIAEFVSGFISHPWNLNFQPVGLADCINKDEDYDLWDVAIPQKKSAENQETMKIELADGSSIFSTYEGRFMENDDTLKDALKVYGHHVRVGSGGCTKIGLSKNMIEYLRKNSTLPITDRTYLIKDRKPLLLIHLLRNTNKDDPRLPDYVFALGLGFPASGAKEKIANFVVNTVELKSNLADSDQIEQEDDDDDDVG
ncbi:MAG: Z1 domain-containing protein [Clostridia bacterium]|nr:Z1 domain-containing protein [Clostridia bacterium]